MQITISRKVVVGSIAALAVAGGGVGIAASKLDTPGQRSQAIVDDAAQQLGIPSAKLSDALKKALENQLDAAVAAGRLTQAQADAMKARIESGGFPIFGGMWGPHGGPFGHGEELTAAATFLGVTEAELRTQLASGKTLAQVATAQGKSVDGLIDAIVAAEKQEHPTASDAQLKQRVTDLVNGVRPSGPFGHHRGGGSRFDMGPPTF